MASSITHSGLLHEASSQMLITQWDGHTLVTDAPPVFAQIGVTPVVNMPLMLIQTHDRQGLPKPNAIVRITLTQVGALVLDECRSDGDDQTQGYATGYGTVYSTNIAGWFGGIIAAQPSDTNGDLAAAQTITHVVTSNPRGEVVLRFQSSASGNLQAVRFLIQSGGADIDVLSSVTYAGR